MSDWNDDGPNVVEIPEGITALRLYPVHARAAANRRGIYRLETCLDAGHAQPVGAVTSGRLTLPPCDLSRTPRAVGVSVWGLQADPADPAKPWSEIARFDWPAGSAAAAADLARLNGEEV